MTTRGQVNEIIVQLLSLTMRLTDLYEGVRGGFAGLTNHVLELLGVLGPLTDHGFSTALGPPTALNVGSAGALGYVLIDGLDEASYTGIVRAGYDDSWQGLYVFRSGTVTIGPDGRATPEPVLGPNLARASLSAITAAWREAVDADHRAQLLLVITSS